MTLQATDVILRYNIMTFLNWGIILRYDNMTSTTLLHHIVAREYDIQVLRHHIVVREYDIPGPKHHIYVQEYDNMTKWQGLGTCFAKFSLSIQTINARHNMAISIKTYKFDECYLSVMERLNINEAQDTATVCYEPTIVYPKTDGSILDSVISVYINCPRLKMPREIAQKLKVNVRELGGAIHILTGMTHTEFLHQYRLRSMRELLLNTHLSTTTIAKFFGYSSLQSMNQFLSDQTGLTANEIREGKNPETKIKKLAWWMR